MKILSIFFPRYQILVMVVGGAGREIEYIIKGKSPINNKTTVYVCSNFSCSPPITNKDDLLSFLQ